MKISIEGPETIKFYPETVHEKENLDALWKVLIRCDEDSKVLCPVGEYRTSKHDNAQFAVQDQRR
jgi:hypothetical protein